MYEVKRRCRHTVDQHQRQLTGSCDAGGGGGASAASVVANEAQKKR